jgi:ribosome-interacting GTPase 1
MRLFKNRKETFDQLIMTGSLRYLDDQTLLNAIVGYNRLADMTEWRAMENERKIALEQNYPVIYENFDASCLLLDIPGKKADFSHTDILTGTEAQQFCREVSKVFVSRLRFMRLSYDTYRMLKKESQNLDGLLEKFLD